MAGTIANEEKITKLVRKEVMQIMREVLSDPDAGLVLSQNMVARLKRSQKAKKAGDTQPLARTFRQYNI